MKTDFTDEEHREHCRLAGCGHPAVHEPPFGQGWCARCRCVAFGRIYEGLAYRNGEIFDLNTGKILPPHRPS